MIYKGWNLPVWLFVLPFLAATAHAERRTVMVVDASSSGKLVRVNAGSSVGLLPGDPVLFSVGDQKIAAGRVFRSDPGSAIIAVLEKYGAETPKMESDYELLFGEPFDEAANLPDYVADREEEPDNPANEKFLQPSGEETTPELDDDNYSPEITLRPKFPEARTYNPHNITVGLSFFRNGALATALQPEQQDGGKPAYDFYQGYAIRYAYTFQSHYWLKARAPALLSIEGMFGIYNFDHTFPTSTLPTQLRVMPIGLNVRYLIELNKLFRVYPYIGYLYNLVSTTSGTTQNLEPLQGGRLLGGAGAQLVVSDSIDARLEGGSDGVMAGLVVKF